MGVMNTKLGTNAFGVTQGVTHQNNAPSNLSATDKDKIGGDNVGDVLNKIADPNYVDTSKKLRTAGNPNLDKDAFFKLMMAQMKNQDPTNPLKSHEMAAQLANFSSLEQMQNINTTLTEMKNGQKPVENFQAINLIGKAVAGDSAKVSRSLGDKEHEFRFALPMDASTVSVKVRDADGEVVRVYDLKGLKKGDNKITWNGENEKGTKLPPGNYDFFIEAKDGEKKIAVKTDFDGLITGVNYSAEGPVLIVGNQTIRLKDVKKITDPSLMKNDQKVTDVTSLDLKKEPVAGDTKKEGNIESRNATLTGSAESAPAAKSKIMDNVGLSREMMDRVAKETKKETVK